MEDDSQSYWEQVIADVLAGNTDRFREIVQEYQDSMRFAVAFHVRNDPDRIDEVVHRAFIRAYHALDRFRVGEPLAPWLKQIARNEALHEIRSLCRQARLKSEVLQCALAEVRQTAEPPEEKLARLRQCMDGLREDARRLVRMHYFDKMSFDAIASAVGRSAGALRVAMLGIRRSLRVCIEG